MNTRKLKDKKYGGPAVMDIEVIKAPGYLKLFKFSKDLFNNLDATYG